MNAPQNNDPRLPALREDLEIIEGAPASNGAKTWMIFDAFANRYYEIDGEAMDMLSAWPHGDTVSALQRYLVNTTGHLVSPQAISYFIHFLDASGLLLQPAQGWRGIADKVQASRPNALMWAVHNYLFIKVPLLRPDAMLRAAMPFVAPLYTPAAGMILLGITLLGLYLVSRQWSEFLGTFSHLFSWEGAALYGVALIVTKSLHELGHAFTATRYGCKVHTMGVAFIVMMPMLYSDVSDAWRLKSRRQRAFIDAAGMIVELVLAGVATFLWVFLPDGPLRSIAFVTATTSWIMSLTVNLSPLMRFDGYYLFADLMGISNLQERAFALGRWKIREILFGLGDPAPEALATKTRGWMILYAWFVWVYRLVVFTGIALVVYHMFFKLLGIVLFLVEIGWFVVKPIAAELRKWMAMRTQILATRRTKITFGCVGLLALVLVIPWSTSVRFMAVMEPKNFARLYPPSPAHILRVQAKQGDVVRQGDIIATLDAPKLRHDINLTRTKLALMEARLARRTSDGKDRAETLWLENERDLLRGKIEGLEREVERLTLRATSDGILVELNPSLHAGRWVTRDEEIGLIVQNGPTMLRGYLSQDDVWRIREGAKARFIDDDPRRARTHARVASIAYSGAEAIDVAALASTFGGDVPVRETKDQRDTRLAPANAVFLTTLEAEREERALNHVHRGVVEVDGKAESFVVRFVRQTLKVLVRESGA